MKMNKKDFISLLLFLLLIVVVVQDQAIILPNQVLIAADLGVSFAEIGIMIGVYIIVHGISILIFGYLTDIVQRKKLLLFSGFLWSFTAIMHMFVEQFWQLFLVRLVAAVAAGVTTPVAFSYLSDVISSDSRSQAFAWWGLITTLGGLIAGGLALAFNRIPYEKISTDTSSIKTNMNYIITHYPDLLNTWRYPFLYLGIVALIFTFLNLFFTKEPKRAAKEKILEDVLAQDNVRYSYRIKFSDLKYVFKRKSNFFLVMNLFDVVASSILIVYLFPYINLEMGISFGDSKGLYKLIALLLIAGFLGFGVGQFGLARWADKKVQGGNMSGRVKVATICSIVHLPFLLLAFSMSPNVRTSSFFFGKVHVNEIGFWWLWIVFAILLGVGLAFVFGIGPSWYASLIDINYPEHRGTMIAMASLLDAFGRALGAILGGILVTTTDSFSATIFWATLIFGIISTCFWVPLFFTCDKDFRDVTEVMKQRAEELKKQQTQPDNKEKNGLDTERKN